MTPPHPDLASFLKTRPKQIAKGPVAIIFIEDDAAIAETLHHHLVAGFHHILALSPQPIAIDPANRGKITNLFWQTRRPAAHVEAINAIIAAVPEGTWIYYCFNAEFLFFPFSENRKIGEMLAFHAEERRSAMLSYVIDLYANDLSRHPNAVSMENAMFDYTGYYALARTDEEGKPKERQLDFFGGLRWRFEEFLPHQGRTIDRISLFRATRDLKISTKHRFNIEEYNTCSCPWHNNLTAAVTSFRVAKALTTNPESRNRIRDFTWSNSRRFEWRAQQLMDYGLMEPGQWF